MAFKKATRSKAKLRLLLDGPSGSGKTYTALRLAMALCPPGGKIAVLDTERGSASLYADQYDEDDRVTFKFDVDEPADYSPKTFVRAIWEAGEAGYDVLILDSITHAWEGVKDEADKGAARARGNTWAGWKDARPQEKEMLDAMLQFPGHLIATARVKTVWEVTENEKGKKEPKKIGLAPEQKAGIEYEFTLAIDMDTDHRAVVTKSRCSAVADAVVVKPGAKFARTLLEWLETGEVATPVARQEQPQGQPQGNGMSRAGDLQVLLGKRMAAAAISPPLTMEEKKAVIQGLFGVVAIKELPADRIEQEIEAFGRMDADEFLHDVLSAAGRLQQHQGQPQDEEPWPDEPPAEEPPAPKAEEKPASAPPPAQASKPAPLGGASKPPPNNKPAQGAARKGLF